MFLFSALFLPQAETALFIQMYASDTFVTRNRRKEEDEKALQVRNPMSFRIVYDLIVRIHRGAKKQRTEKN
jgi:hypothetical protein